MSASIIEVMIRIATEEVVEVLSRILVARGFENRQASLSSKLFAYANCDGVLSHGLDRFSSYLSMIDEGLIDPAAQPSCTWNNAALERWDGRKGPGNLNAHFCMDRAIELSELHGVGCVALSNTNHWMRGGNFGWQAADAGKIGICWTNTMPNLPPWGSENPLIGNNPLVIAVPREKGHIVLDMAMSQFSYGALSRYHKEGRQLPVPGGYNMDGALTTDPAAIEETSRPLPIGFWKGSGLSMLLDLMAALLSGGKATCDIPHDPGQETGVSQVFIVFSPPEYPGLADRVVASLQADGDTAARYPGERTLENRRESGKSGLPVYEDVWKKIRSMN